MTIFLKVIIFKMVFIYLFVYLFIYLFIEFAPSRVLLYLGDSTVNERLQWNYHKNKKWVYHGYLFS